MANILSIEPSPGAVDSLNPYWADRASHSVFGNYGARKIALVRGEGCRVWDVDGRQYLDFLSGISVTNLGHSHPAVVAAIEEQAGQLLHCSNLYMIPAQIELAEWLVNRCFAERVFFANSGAEVNEGALKLARRYSMKKFGPGRHEVITFRNSFHGRTMAMITATGQDKVQKGYEPLLDGFHYATYNDLESVKALVSPRTCAIMLEPVLGEGGIVPATTEFLQGLRQICDEQGILLIFDEIQCGVSRTGYLFAYEHSGVEPDLCTWAKAMGNGVPIGALFAKAELADIFEPGSHGTTFGGNPLACATSLAVMRTIERDHISERATVAGQYFANRLCETIGEYENVADIRGRGLMVGIELKHPGADVATQCLERGLLINCTMGNVLRILPPLIVTVEEIDEAVAILAEVIKHVGDVHAGIVNTEAASAPLNVRDL